LDWNSGNSTSFNSNTSGYTASGLGQHVTGTFIANSPTQVITFSGVAFASLLYGFQLRETAVPEPAMGLLLGGFGMLLMRRRC